MADQRIGRYEVKCASCMRTSPMVDGPDAVAAKQLKMFSWSKAVDGTWVCPICLTRSTTKNKKFTR